MTLLTPQQLEEAIKQNRFLRQYNTTCPYCSNAARYWYMKKEFERNCIIRISCQNCNFIQYENNNIERELNEQEVFTLKCLI